MPCPNLPHNSEAAEERVPYTQRQPGNQVADPPTVSPPIISVG